MKALLVFVVLLAAVSAGRIDKLKKRWDIAEGISFAGAAGKKEGHERSVKEAWNKLSKADQAYITNPTKPIAPLAAFHTPTDIVLGIQYPDMPIGGAKTSALGDDLKKPDKVTAPTFAGLFKAGALGARNTFVANTHFGCLQFWHAMAPEPYVKDAQGNKVYKVWKNKDLSALIKAGAKRIWDTAVSHLKGGRKALAEFHLGRVLHTIGDSFAKGHTVRGPTACGPIFVFQEYNAQKGNEEHGKGDKPDDNMDTFSCTVDRVKAALEAWVACAKDNKQCAFPSVIENVFNIDPSVADLDAGGSLEKYAGPDAKKTGTKKVIPMGNRSLTVYFPAQGNLKRVAGSADVSQVCPDF